MTINRSQKLMAVAATALALSVTMMQQQPPVQSASNEHYFNYGPNRVIYEGSALEDRFGTK